MTPRILIADDHALIREALAMTIIRCWPTATVIQAKDFPSVWAEAVHSFDLCICDLAMPGAIAVDGMRQLLAIQPTLRLIAITGSADEVTVQKILALNVAGLIPKITEGGIVEAAIRLVLAGGKYLPDGKLVTDSPKGLTSSQKLVLQLMCKGLTNKEIAKTLEIAPSTVKTHVDNILNRLGARNRTDACQRFSEPK
jgi:DNA-binding NarL/FixJ family response regulator